MNAVNCGLRWLSAVLMLVMVSIGIWMLARTDLNSQGDRAALQADVATAKAEREVIKADIRREAAAIRQKLDKILDAIEAMKASRPADHDVDPDPPGAVDEIPMQRKEQ